MMKMVVSGKTVEDAVNEGLRQWKVGEDRVKMTVLEQPAKGLFGLIGARQAKVELELIPDPAEEAELFLRDVLRTMGLEVELNRQMEEDGLLFNLSGPEIGILIGRRGQTLDALQYLVNIVANRQSDRHVRIMIDAEQFRSRRKQTLEELSMRIASKVVRTKQDVVLEPMTSLDRKIIHAKLQDHPHVRTYSQGDEPNRKVVVSLK
ncbi:DNA-binding protein [Paenibacillus sp. J31TS4]|uniref:RNA-binding cell elongation regulator Jag/EloR n=1 Tax=Paenibacillus sp. J31TS4 TaxID=2807195 RepID=UPI001B22A2D7|nr:RNA-binding cell elongation regulator Jag/EloR [Paenibacillus sp. J31TS4]GIP40644.1 DNA-binding protein [Paenibacillus sp. J31TS4]